MHPVVKSFRENFVEGRFVILLNTLLVIGMRILLYKNCGLPEIYNTDDNYLWKPVAHLFEDPLISLSASTISVIIISWILFSINNRYSLIRSRSNLPYTVPLFLLSLHPYLLVMTGNYIAIIIILIALTPLLESYQKPDSYLYSFRSSILIAVSSLFQIYALILIPLWWRGEKSMRGPQLNSFLASLFGVLLVYVTMFSFYFVSDNISDFLQPMHYFIAFSIPDIPDYSIFEWVAIFIVAVIFIINIILSAKEYVRDKVLTLSLMRFIVYMVVVLLLLQILFWKETLFYLILSVTLLSFLSSYLYSKTTSKTDIYIAYSLLFLLILFYLSQYFPQTFLIG
jgi:hypothetical protein